MSDEQEFQRRMGRVEDLIEKLEGLPDPATRGAAQELVQALLDLHGTGLERMLEITFQAGAAGQSIIDDLARDDLAGSLLLLHGLHPLDLETRVRHALEKVRPSLALHGGDVELLSVTKAGVVSLRLEGSCHGCASSQATLKFTIEEAIYAAGPDVTEIQVEGVAPREPAPISGFVPMSSLLRKDSAVH